MICEQCEKIHNGEYGSGRFCSTKCARGYSTKHKRQEINETVSIKLKGHAPWNKGKSLKKDYRPVRRNPKGERICNWCGQTKCLRKDICKKHQIFPSLIKYFGMDACVIGTICLYKEYERIIEIVSNLYIDKEMSIQQLMDYFEYYGDIRNFNKILNSIGVEKRTISDALSNAVKNGRVIIPHSFKYKCGHHITWEGKRVFLRSSYEFDYAIYLDESRIKYNVESLRFQYWDSQLLKNRIAIPDFHIIDDNILVEIKSNYTLDVINMRDKKECYELAGYKVLLIVDGEEMPV